MCRSGGSPPVPRRIPLVALAAVLALAGCGTAARAPAIEPVPARVAVAAPTEVVVPAIGVASTLVEVGLQPDGTAEVPPVNQPMQAAWYSPGVAPGDVGPAVVLGHVSGRPDGAQQSVPGIFARLGELRPGDEITIGRADGSRAVFAVTHAETYPKSAFPTATVWGDTAGPELRLITCGGVFDQAAHSYDSNIVVYAKLRDGS